MSENELLPAVTSQMVKDASVDLRSLLAQFQLAVRDDGHTEGQSRDSMNGFATSVMLRAYNSLYKAYAGRFDPPLPQRYEDLNPEIIHRATFSFKGGHVDIDYNPGALKWTECFEGWIAFDSVDLSNECMKTLKKQGVEPDQWPGGRLHFKHGPDRLVNVLDALAKFGRTPMSNKAPGTP